MAVTLTPEQSAVVHNRGGELLVSAAAGSGKTRVLVERLLSRVIDEGLDIDEFLVITFTRDAATELRSKILAELNLRLAQNPEDKHLKRQTTLIYRAQISTIHAFCTVFLRENSHLLHIDPDFGVADTDDADLLLVQTLERLLESRYEQIDKNGFGGLVDSFSDGQDDAKLKEITLSIYKRIQAAPDPMRWLDEHAAAFHLHGVTDAGQTKWGRFLMQDTQTQVRYWLQQIEIALEMIADSGEDYLVNAYQDHFQNIADMLAELEQALSDTWDTAYHVSSKLTFARLKPTKKTQDPDTRDRVKAIRDKCKDALKKLLEKRFECSSAELLKDMQAICQPVQQLFQLVKDLHSAFAATKRRRKLLDFNDLEHFTVKALFNDGKPSELAQRCQSKFAEVMVDEYQDTNEVQNAIFHALTDGGKTLFQVGDMKQSIYRFRLADPTIFLGKYHAFAPAEQAQEGEARRLVLSRNFRSRKQVLDSVNFLFQNIMSTQLGEMEYTADHRLNLGLCDLPVQDKDNVELNVVDLSAMEADETRAAPPKDQIEAWFVAKRVRQLLDAPFMVAEGETFRPVRPEDIAILYRSPNKVCHYLTEALNAWDIPWQMDADDNLLSCTEVRVVLSFLQVIDNPRQDVPLISVLRSPVYAFTPDQLAQIRANHKEGDFYSCVAYAAEWGDAACQHFLEQLEQLRLRMVDSSCSQMIWYLYNQLGLMSLFSAMSGGQHRQENLLALYEYACSFEEKGDKGVFAFVSHLRRLTEQSKPLKQKGQMNGNGVQIKSIHRSKGLEFPVVLLAGLNRQFNTTDEKEPMLFHSALGVGPKLLDHKRGVEYTTLARTAVQLKISREMKSEELRLLYVAMTRAQEKLIMVMTFKDFAKAQKGLFAIAGAKPDPEALLSLKSAAEWILLPTLARRDAQALWLGNVPEVFPRTSDHWHIHLIYADNNAFAPEVQMQTENPAGREQEPVSQAEQVQMEQLTEWLHWHYPHEILANLPSKVTATQIKGRLLDAEVSEETVQPICPMELNRPHLDKNKHRLTRAQMGSAVHAVMERMDLRYADTMNGVKAEIQRLTEANFLTAEQAEAVRPYQVFRFWSSPLGQRAKRNPTLKREFKFSILYPASVIYPEVTDQQERVLLQGVVDCCFEEEEGFTVVDFKSDHVQKGEEACHAERYRSQLEIYSHALEEIYHKPVKERILWFLFTGTGVSL